MSVQTFPVARQDEALEHLRAHGYTVVENVLDAHEVRRYRELLEAQFERERREPFDPPDGEPAPGDDELRGLLPRKLLSLGGRARAPHAAPASLPIGECRHDLAGVREPGQQDLLARADAVRPRRLPAALGAGGQGTGLRRSRRTSHRRRPGPRRARRRLRALRLQRHHHRTAHRGRRVACGRALRTAGGAAARHSADPAERVGIG